MTAASKPVADRDANLTPEAKLVMRQNRATRALTVAITNESWGKAMTHNMRQAFAEYMRRFHLDIGEVDNMGGKPYRNGYYFKRRIAEMRTQGLIDWSSGHHIGPDPRLDALQAAGDEWGTAQNIQRARERIIWAVPADATHAYVATVKLKSDERPLEGCDWITPLRTKKVKDWGDDRKFKGWKEVPADPVGADEPEKTVVTRAWRRCGLLVAAEIPELRKEEAIMDAEAEVVHEEVEAMATEDAARNAAIEGNGAQMITAGPVGDVYSLGQPPVAEKVPASTVSARTLGVVERYMERQERVAEGYMDKQVATPATEKNPFGDDDSIADDIALIEREAKAEREGLRLGL